MRNLWSFVFMLILFSQAMAQNKKNVEGVKVQSSYAQKLGTTAELRDLVVKENISPEKKALWKKNKAVPPNFKNRGGNSAIIPELEHQGVDPVWQKEVKPTRMLTNEPLVNVDGLSRGGPPQDPTGAIGKDHFLQAINSTQIGVYDKQGVLLNEFTGNTLWGSIGFSSAGDPIILYDETIDRWVITEFPSSNNLLLGISLTSDPMGSYDVYNFATPSFPDYPKWGVWTDSYTVTTNEFGGGLKVYAINRQQIIDGETNVDIQRFEIPRNTNSEQGFLVATPLDWAGDLAPPAGEGPYYLKMEDSSWGTVPQDAIHVYDLNVDWANPDNSSFEMTEIETAPFDPFPCGAPGPGFSCAPQPAGDGLDACPEYIMNNPHYRNFGSHESMVLSFVTDATDGDNLAGVRWMEFRKSGAENWSLYQEGTFAPDDGLHRYLSGIALGDNGSIGLAYNFSGEDSFAGIAYTGRSAGDPLGQMTIEEVIAKEGENTIAPNSQNLRGRFSDYTHISVDPENPNTFWFTASYASNGNGTDTRIIAFEIAKDTFDLAMEAILSPTSQNGLSANEELIVRVKNKGINSVDRFKVGYVFENGMEVLDDVEIFLDSDSVYTHVFSNTFDLSQVGSYNFKTFTSLVEDTSFSNDTLSLDIKHIPNVDVAVLGISNLGIETCAAQKDIVCTIQNRGFENLTELELSVILNGVENQVVPWQGDLAYLESVEVPISILTNLLAGNNDIEIIARSPNGQMDEISEDNTFAGSFGILADAVTITLELLLDAFPNETSWQLSNSQGVLLGEGDNYSTPYETVIEEFCLDPDQCYTFIIFDSVGDGLTSFGNEDGSYSFYDENGLTLASIFQPDFGSLELNDFCATFECGLEAEALASPTSEEGAADGMLIIEVTAGAGPFSYSIDGGNTFQSSNVFTGLAEGDYDFVVLGGGDCTFDGIVSLSFCMLSATFEVVEASNAGAADGSITINATNTTGEVEYSILNGTEFQSDNFFPNLFNGPYPVVIRDEGGCEFTAFVEVDILIDVDEAAIKYGLEIYPNPTEGVFQVKLHGVSDADLFIPISIYDGNGKIIQRANMVKYDQTHTAQLSLYSYPAGTYFFRIHHKEMKRLYRIIKLD